jgi:hypothetical protein
MTISRRTFLHTTGVALSAPFLVKAFGDAAQAALAPANYLVPFTDPKFGNKVVKVSNPNSSVPGLGLTWKKIARHHYSIDQAWNADQSLLVLFKGTPGRLFLDGRTYKPLFALKHPGAIRWHRTNPDLMVFVGVKGVGYWNVRKNTLQVLSPLAGYTKLDFGQNNGNLSDDGTMLTITATRSDGKRVIFAYDLVSGKKFPDIDMTGWYEVGETTISPLKKYIASRSRKTSSVPKEYLIFGLDGKLVQHWPERERPGHNDFTVDRNGYEVAIGRSKSDDYKLISRRLVDGKITFLSSRPCKASHTSTRNLRNPGWMFETFTYGTPSSSQMPYGNEITAVATDGSENVRRLAQHNSVGDAYDAEPHGVPSPDGKKAIFASNWGVNGGPIAAYVAEFTS